MEEVSSFYLTPRRDLDMKSQMLRLMLQACKLSCRTRPRIEDGMSMLVSHVSLGLINRPGSRRSEIR